MSPDRTCFVTCWAISFGSSLLLDKSHHAVKPPKAITDARGPETSFASSTPVVAILCFLVLPRTSIHNFNSHSLYEYSRDWEIIIISLHCYPTFLTVSLTGTPMTKRNGLGLIRQSSRWRVARASMARVRRAPFPLSRIPAFIEHSMKLLCV